MHPDVNHNEYVEGCRNKQRPLCRCRWGLRGGKQGGRTQPPLLRGRFRGTRGAASSSWLTSAAARGPSGRDKFAVRTGSAFLKAELLSCWVGRCIEWVPRKAVGLCSMPRLRPAEPWRVAGAQLPLLSAVVSCCAAYSHIPARSV